MDIDVWKETIKDSSRNTKWMRNGYCTQAGMAEATAPWGKVYHAHPFTLKYFERIYLDCVQDGELAADFANKGDDNEKYKLLIPVINCHGLTCHRTASSGFCRDLASNGYIVFSLDHHDGTCSYSRL